jgi:hypothetical protein
MLSTSGVTLIPQNTQLNDFNTCQSNDVGLHLFANTLQAQALGFGRGRVTAFAGVLGYTSRPRPGHQPSIAPSGSSHLAARNPAATVAQNRAASCAAATAAHTTTDPTTAASNGRT